jgi:hypothetical protein
MDRSTSCAVMGDESLVDDYAGTGRLPDCLTLAAISRENPRMPIDLLLAEFEAHHRTCLYCAAIERTDALLEVRIPEMECECRRTDVDLFDPRGCPVHDANSPWNVRLRATTSVQMYESEVA